jgi:hypothetical protein
MEIYNFKNEGVYVIVNLVNNEMYIGSSMNLGNRKTKHFSLLNHNKNPNNLLQSAVNKHGIENFKFGVLEYCTEFLLKREQYFVDKLNPVYNITRDIINNTPSEESKKKMSISRLKLFKEGMKPNGSKSIIQTDLEGNFINEYSSIRQASIQLGMDRSEIQRVLYGKYKQMNGYMFSYKLVL